VAVAALAVFTPTSTPVAMAASLPVPPAPPAPTTVTWPREPGPSATWLEALNYYRTLGGAPPVTEDPALSAGDLAHARYTLATGRLAHDQNVPHPTASAAGLRAAQHSNGWASTGTGQAQREPVDAWTSSIGHGLAMLRPEMRTTGWAMLQDPASPSSLRATAWLDVYSGPEGARPAQITTMPIDQAVIDADVTPVASQHVVATCPGYREADRLPLLWVRLPHQPSGAATVQVRRDGVNVAACAFTGATYANSDPSWGPYYRTMLQTTPVVGIVLAEQYRDGAGYTVAMSVPTSAGTQQTAWAFRAASPGGATPLAPRRLFDTRIGEAQAAAAVVKRPVTSGAGVLWVKVTDTAGIPATGVSAVILNVTAVAPPQDGFVSVYPCESWNDPWPGTASVNTRAGAVVSNTVITPVSANGHVCVLASSPTDVVADVSGVFETGGAHRAVAPRRLFDTRPWESPGLRTVATTTVGARVLQVRATGVGGVPSSGVAAVSLNVVAASPAGAGYLLVYPCTSPSSARPYVASLTFDAGETVGNAVVVPVSSSGDVCIASSAETHVVADVNGWFPTGAGFGPAGPVRLVDTRPAEPQGAIPVAKQRLGGLGRILRVDVTGVAGVADAASMVSLNVTAVAPATAGFVTVYPCAHAGVAPPLAASVTFAAGDVVPNAVITPVSADGGVCLYASTALDVVVDVAGWFR
jgi:uncharacterized protein YkwD